MAKPLSPAEFVNSVVRLQPAFAAFDCDGTLWSGDAGEGFFDWELRRKVVSDQVITAIRARYADYRAGKVSEDDMCGEMVTLHRGLRESDVKRLAAQFFEENIARNIFPEMQELVGHLIEKYHALVETYPPKNRILGVDRLRFEEAVRTTSEKRKRADVSIHAPGIS